MTTSVGRRFPLAPWSQEQGHQGQCRGHVGTSLLDYHEGLFPVQRGHVVHHFVRSHREAEGP